jgi:integrase
MWKNPGSLGKAIRKVRADCGYPDLTTHWGRKTVATLLDEAKQTPRQVADLLGHTDIAVTQKHYFARGMPNPHATVAINAWHQPKK